MGEPVDRFEYVGFWRRVGEALLDIVILNGPFILLSYWLDFYLLSYHWRTPWPDLAYSLFVSLPALYFVTRYGGTPGKLILNMRIVIATGRYLNLGHALRREFLNHLLMLATTAKMYFVLSQVPARQTIANSDQVAECVVKFGGWWIAAEFLLALLIVIDILAVAFNRHKRALYDLFARSYVITKRSYDAVHAPADDSSAGPTGDALPAAQG